VEYIVHKVNTEEKLSQIPTKYGIELDLRIRNNKLVLCHEHSDCNTEFEKFLQNYNHKILVANIKDSGIEDIVIETLKRNKIENFFLLDIEFPYLIKNYEVKGKYLSTRFSEFEDIKTSSNLVNKVDWIWIDTFNKLPIDNQNLEVIKKFKSCLVSPSRWGRSNEIDEVIKELKDLKYFPDFTMVDYDEINIWENSLV
tara:strand:+ start:710 stop:1303 length:594 start_codon:yes stop_codon:yes gene_type:complete